MNLKLVGTLDQTIQKLFEDVDEDVAFDTEMAQLVESRTEANRNDEYDVSERAHKEIQSLKEREVARLKKKAEDAVQHHDSIEATRIKERRAHVASF